MSLLFFELAESLHGRVAGREHTGLTFTASCPVDGGRLLVWVWRPGGGPNSRPGYRCHDCGRHGDLFNLHRLVENRDAPAA